jgi:hypothetical protein
MDKDARRHLHRPTPAVEQFSMHTFVILNVTEGGVRDLLYLPFHIGAKRRSTNANAELLSHNTSFAQAQPQTKKPSPHFARSSAIPLSGGLRERMWQASTGAQGLGGVRIYRVAVTVGCSTSADCTGGRWVCRKVAMSCWKFGLFAGMVISAGSPGKSSPSAFTSIPCSSR